MGNAPIAVIDIFGEAVLNATPGGPPDRAKLAQIMHRHGLTPAPASPQTPAAVEEVWSADVES